MSKKFQARVERARRPLIVGGDYSVIVTAARRVVASPHVIRLQLKVEGGDYDGISVPFTIKEPHAGQSEGSFRNWVHALDALNEPVPAAAGETNVDGLVGRRLIASLYLDLTSGGQRVSVAREGLRRPLHQQ